MNPIRPASLVLAIASLFGTLGNAQAQGLTREQVRAELAEAVRNGDMIADHDRLLTYRDIAPHRYPARAVEAGKTRAQVLQELAEAVRTGDIVVNNEHALTAYEAAPHLYPARVAEAGKTRAEVRAELLLAQRLGDTPVNEQGLTPAQQFPARYAAAIAEYQQAQQASQGERSAVRTVQDSFVR